MEKLLILGSNFGSIEFIKRAKRRGIYTIVSDEFDEDWSVAKKYADESWNISIFDIDTLYEKCIENGITAVFCGVQEMALESVRRLCKKLGLPCYCDNLAFDISRDKKRFKELCKQLNIPVPLDVDPSIIETTEIEYPVVTKAINLTSNRGMTYCYSKSDLLNGVKLAKEASGIDTIIIEKMIIGKEYAAYYVLADGEASLAGYGKLYTQPGKPKNDYILISTVADGYDRYCEYLHPRIVRLLKEMGCVDGYAWVQFFIDNEGKFYVIEPGYRFGGELFNYCMDLIMKFDSFSWMLDTAFGVKHRKEDLPNNLANNNGVGCSYLLWASQNGVIDKVYGVHKIKEYLPKALFDLRLQKKRTVMSNETIGVICFTAKDHNHMCEIIDYINSNLIIEDADGNNLWIHYTDYDEIRRTYIREYNL